jgi:hypothetical protein
LDIAEGSVNHYLAQLSRYGVFVVGLPTSEASLTYHFGAHRAGLVSAFLKHCSISHINSTCTDTISHAPTPLLTCRHSRRLSATIFEPPPPLLSFRHCLRLSNVVSALPTFLAPLDHHFPPSNTDINQPTLLPTFHRNFRSPAAIFLTHRPLVRRYNIFTTFPTFFGHTTPSKIIYIHPTPLYISPFAFWNIVEALVPQPL